MLFLKEKESDIRELLKYVINNKKGISNYKKDYYIGSQTESQISHNVKALKSYGAKAYSEITFSNMLAMKMARINGWNLIELLLDRHYEEVKDSIKYYRENVWIKKNKSEHYAYKPKQGHLPILKHKRVPLQEQLRKLSS